MCVCGGGRSQVGRLCGVGAGWAIQAIAQAAQALLLAAIYMHLCPPAVHKALGGMPPCMPTDAQLVPFLLEAKLKEVGGLYEKAAENWHPHAVRDGHLVTGGRARQLQLCVRAFFSGHAWRARQDHPLGGV